MEHSTGKPAMRTAFLVLWLGAFAAITVGSLIPQSVLGAEATDEKLIQHVAAYALLSGLTWPAFAIWGGRRLLIIALALAAFGFAIELIQPFVGRRYSLPDGAANALGVFIGILLGRLIRLALGLRKA